jgi:hypothetical protein
MGCGQSEPLIARAEEGVLSYEIGEA